MRNQHDLENKVEEYEVQIRQAEDGSKHTVRKYQELQKKYKAMEKEITELKDKLKKTEADKTKISEKWIKLSSKNRHEDLIRKRCKETESSNEELHKQLLDANEKVEKLTRENNVLLKSHEELQETLNQQISKTKALKSKLKSVMQEKDQIDSAAEDLFER